MKSYNSLFPSYYYHEDDTAVFFESNVKFDWCSQIRSEEILTESIEINFQAITGSSELVNLLRRAKAVSNSFGRKNFEELRGKTNYYEGLGKGCYLNRSAMKLVNLDYVFSLIEPWSATYTTSSYLNKKKVPIEFHKLSERPHFSFVDLCGGPGGFIECIVLKCRHLGVAVTGFGMTLLIGDEEPGFRGIMKACNWNISHLQDPPYSIILSDQKEDSSCGTQLNNDNCSQSNSIAIGMQNSFILRPDNNIEGSVSEKSKKHCECRVFLVGGATGTGDICAPENMHSLFSLMQLELPLAESPFMDTSCQTRRKNCHLKCSPREPLELNGEVEEKSSTEKINGKKYVYFVCSDGFDHETEAFRIVLCQVIGMMKTLQVGGNFIMKVFSCTKVQTIHLMLLPFICIYLS